VVNIGHQYGINIWTNIRYKGMISQEGLALLPCDSPEEVVGQHCVVQKSFTEACRKKGFPFMDHFCLGG